jgi:hypothetical protein
MTSQTSGSKIDWFLARDGRQHGPLADAEMTKFVELGHLRPNDLVWRAGFAEWKPASAVFDLNDKTVTGAPKTEPAAQPSGPVAKSATVAAPSAPTNSTPANSAATVLKPAADAPITAASSPAPVPAGAEAVAAAAAAGVKTGIGAKKPLETPLLNPTQLQPATRPAAEPDDAHIHAASPVTSLNQRLQRAASERAAAPVASTAAAATAPGATHTQPLHKSWPHEAKPAEPAAAFAPTPIAPVAPTAPTPQPSAPGKLPPLREMRPAAPVPLMPLEPRTGAVAPTNGPAITPDGVPPRKKGAKPNVLPAPDGKAARSLGRSLGVGLTLAIIVGGGGWLAYTSGGAITSSFSKSTANVATSAPVAAKPAVATQVTAVATSAPPAAVPPVAAASTTAPPAAPVASAMAAPEANSKPRPFITSAKTAEQIDADLKRSAIWQLISREFPEWHRDRVAEIAKLAADKRDPTAVSKHIAESIVALRRKFADQALSASPEQLRAIAIAFLENLRQLSAQSTDACYGFISQGETYPAVIDLMRQGDRTEALHKQAVAVFEAVAAGRKAPQTNLPPRKTDYDTLATELTARGWSQADLQMFSDAKALAAAQPEQVCKMVQDWFAAQITIKDPAIQLRLLVESLRPVVAG